MNLYVNFLHNHSKGPQLNLSKIGFDHAIWTIQTKKTNIINCDLEKVSNPNEPKIKTPKIV